MIVDDDMADLQLLGTAFATWSDELQIEARHSAAKALEWFDEHGNDLPNVLLVTDLNMPVMDGADLIRRVRSEYGAAPTSIVFSTSTRDGDVRRSYDAGANAYHAKPMGYHDTAELCRSVLDYWIDVAQRPS